MKNFMRFQDQIKLDFSTTLTSHLHTINTFIKITIPKRLCEIHQTHAFNIPRVSFS